MSKTQKLTVGGGGAQFWWPPAIGDNLHGSASDDDVGG